MSQTPKWQRMKFRDFVPDATPDISLEPLDVEIPADTKDIQRMLSLLSLEQQALQLALSKKNVTDAGGRRVGGIQYHTWRDQVLERFHTAQQRIISLKLALRERNEALAEHAKREDYDPNDVFDIVRELRLLVLDLFHEIGRHPRDDNQILMNDSSAILRKRPTAIATAPHQTTAAEAAKKE